MSVARSNARAASEAARTDDQAASAEAGGPRALLDRSLGGGGASLGLLLREPGNEHGPLELGDQRPVLFVDAGMDLHDAAVGLRARRPHLEPLVLGEEGVSVKDGRRVAELLGGGV